MMVEYVGLVEMRRELDGFVVRVEEDEDELFSCSLVKSG
jgi:hypothetical protein